MSANWQFEGGANPYTETATGLQPNTAAVLVATLNGIELGNAVATIKFLTGTAVPSLGVIMRRSGPNNMATDFFYFSYLETGNLELRFRSGNAYTTINNATLTFANAGPGGSGGPANATPYWFRAYAIGATLGFEIWDIDPDSDAALSHQPRWSLVTSDPGRAPAFGEWGFLLVPQSANDAERVQSFKLQRISALR